MAILPQTQLPQGIGVAKPAPLYEGSEIYNASSLSGFSLNDYLNNLFFPPPAASAVNYGQDLTFSPSVFEPSGTATTGGLGSLSNILGTGLGLYGAFQGYNQTPGIAGYQGEIPDYRAVRTRVPNTYDPNRRPGSAGQRYFSDTAFIPADDADAIAAAQAVTEEQAKQIADLNAKNPAMQTILPETTETAVLPTVVPVSNPASDVISLLPVPKPEDLITMAAGKSVKKNKKDAFDKIAEMRGITREQVIKEARALQTGSFLGDLRVAGEDIVDLVTKGDPLGTLREKPKKETKKDDEIITSSIPDTDDEIITSIIPEIGTGVAKPAPLYEGSEIYNAPPLQPFAVPRTMPKDDETPGISGLPQGIGVAQPTDLGAYLRYLATIKGPGFNQRFSEGGIAGLKEGKYLDGATDGMADEIPATIDRTQPAALSDGEFVIPADVVSHLGNGNSDAGAKVLTKMMDKVRMARTGNKKQGKEIDPNKFLPA